MFFLCLLLQFLLTYCHIKTSNTWTKMRCILLCHSPWHYWWEVGSDKHLRHKFLKLDNKPAQLLTTSWQKSPYFLFTSCPSSIKQVYSRQKTCKGECTCIHTTRQTNQSLSFSDYFPPKLHLGSPNVLEENVKRHNIMLKRNSSKQTDFSV